MRFRQVSVLMAILVSVGFSGCGQSAPRPAAAARSEPDRVSKPSRPPEVRPETRFVNVAPEAGLTAVLYCGGPSKDHLLESVGTGAAFIDYDEDGRLDVFLVNAWALDEEPSQVRVKAHNVLYHNLGEGRFEDVSERAGIDGDGWGCGVCAGDYDNDGLVDLFVTEFGPSHLYRNRGDGTFEDVSEHAGVNQLGWSAGAAFFDADGDEDLDLYVAYYVEATIDEVLAARRTSTWRETVKVMAGPFGLRGGKDRFYRNNGDGTFQDATEEAGMDDVAESYGLGVLASDLDNDGDVDIYVANDSNPNFLYRNDGTGHFDEIGNWSGAGLNGNGVAQAGMGVDAADFDGDGLQEIFVTNFAKDHATLYQNMGNLLFDDISPHLGLKLLTYETLKWGCAFLDFDNDGDLDLAIANGHIYPQVDEAPELKESYRQLPTLLENRNGELSDVSRTAGPGMQEAVSARGLVTGDYDGDGDLDLLVTTIDACPLLLRNDSTGTGHWLKVRPMNRFGSPALNARVTVKTGERVQMRELRSGSSHQSQNALELHFGLGEAATVDSLDVLWPGGHRTELHDLKADQTVTIRLPDTGARRLKP